MEFSSFFISFSRWPSGGSSDILSQKNVSLRSPRAAAKVRLTHALVSTPVLAAGLGLASQETPPVHNEQIRDSKSGERWNHPQGMNLAREFPEGLTELRTAPHLRPLPPSFLLPPASLSAPPASHLLCRAAASSLFQALSSASLSGFGLINLLREPNASSQISPTR